MAGTIDYGIDLGTTNSSVGRFRDGQVRLFANAEGAVVTPSVVHVTGDARMLVGRKAADVWVQDPRNTQAEFKRWMGYSDRLTFPASGKVMSAEEMSAEVLKALRADAERDTGEVVRASVITVPAAFGTLQCEATGRAARLAGFEQASLLQEPIAAALAYGATPTAGTQRWMVFDLGGGTLDIAIVSTRRGRLIVLEHQGDNRLGGKDMDAVIADAILMKALAGQFALPSAAGDPQAFDRLRRRLVRHAERAKIALSAADSVVAELFDLGDDLSGKPIEASVTVTRAEVETCIEPLVDRCLQLAERALAGARVSKADLDRTMLVGGPTQMPILRAALESRLGAKLDTSQDPMTVVARGAALYASTLELAAPTSAITAPASKTGGGGIPIQLSYERASGTARSPVVGILPADAGVDAIKLDADGGFWTSGWVPVIDGVFQVEVVLNDRRPATPFTLAARDKTGRAVVVEPGAFSISFMLPMSAPPLPHTIAVELSTVDGVMQFDPVFKRHSPLPAEARKSYRAERTLRPSELDATLPIKFWETDVSDDPEERWWAGCVHVRADRLTRPVIEGTELELTIKIDASRKMTVEVFIPTTNDSFIDGVYIPDPPTARSQLVQQIDLCFSRLNRAWRGIYESEQPELRERVEQLQTRVETICEQVEADKDRLANDPDAALGPTDALRKIRAQLSQIEEQLETGQGLSDLARQVRADGRWTESLVEQYGTPLEKEEMAHLRTSITSSIEDDDARGLRWVKAQLLALRDPLLNRQPWFWENVHEYLKRPGRRFLNVAEAKTWMDRAEQAIAARNFAGFREAVSRAWDLQPHDQAEMVKEQAAQSGLRG